MCDGPLFLLCLESLFALFLQLWGDKGQRSSIDAVVVLLDFLVSRTVRNKCLFLIEYPVCGILPQQQKRDEGR